MNSVASVKRSSELLTDWLQHSGVEPGDRLPPERELSKALNLSRGDLRKALIALEVHGSVERHVGRGTFLKERHVGVLAKRPLIESLAEFTSPHDAMMARISLEPELAGHAAIHATPKQVSTARQLADDMRRSDDWSSYEELDAQFHELIAVASGNPLLAELHRIVNAVRLSVVWSNLALPPNGPPTDYHSFAEHDDIVTALEQRDRPAAHSAMRKHLKSVRATLLKDD